MASQREISGMTTLVDLLCEECDFLGRRVYIGSSPTLIRKEGFYALWGYVVDPTRAEIRMNFIDPRLRQTLYDLASSDVNTSKRYNGVEYRFHRL